MKQDLATKSLEEFPDVFADIGNVNLYHGKQVISPEGLERMPSEMIYRDLNGVHKELRADVRMRMKKSGTEIAIMCIENQAGICNTMPVRVMGYEYSGYMEQIRGIKERNRQAGVRHYTREIGDKQKLVPVVSLVLYYGEEEWNRPLSLLDMFDLSEEDGELLEPYIQNYKIRLIDLSKQNEEVQEQYRSDFRYVVKYLACRHDKIKFLQMMREDAGELSHPREFLDMMQAITGDRRYRKIGEEISGEFAKGGKITMCSIAEELENQGIQKGMEQGMEQGMRQGMKLCAALLEAGRTDEVSKAMADSALREKLLVEYGID